QGRESPQNYLFTIRTKPDRVSAGNLWLAVTGESAFVYDLWVAPEHRRRGHATAAMRAAENVAVEHGARRIGLNVFGHNRGARALYLRLGYTTMAEQMTKPLDSRAGSATPPRSESRL
ncbi:MAG: GNAT family N-acetyltransferase, partial [Thermoplasmata archaeon]